MLDRLRSKVTEFINCEEGKVGIKTSLSLGLVGGGLLLMQTIYPSTAKAHFECLSNNNCPDNEVCEFWCQKVSGVCTGKWHSKCVSG